MSTESFTDTFIKYHVKVAKQWINNGWTSILDKIINIILSKIVS